MKKTTLPRLKPCPFCGDPNPVLDLLCDEDEYFVHCLSCSIQQIANYREDEAIARWNRRAGETNEKETV